MTTSPVIAQSKDFLFDRDLAAFPTRIAKPEGVRDLLDAQIAEIRARQEVLYADRRQALLVVFQGMDCAGKDSTIKNVFSGVNPQGMHVANFQAPTHNEVAHSYLWRYWREMPRRGLIGVFNRSHYEEVLVMRVHPEYFEQRQLPHPPLDEAFWQSRLNDLRGLEEHLIRNGIHVVKFFLNLSKEEQRRRLLARIDRPHKHWKFDPRDMIERGLWGQYRHAYEQALAATHSPDAPWYVIPADHKPTMRALVAQIVAERLQGLDIAVPTMEHSRMSELEAARIQLESEAT